MYFIAVAIVNLAYIFSELMFNTKLLNVSGGSFNYSDIETIEILGRALSSIGLSLVLVRTIYFFRISKGSKIFLSSLVIIIAHPVFFLGQKEFIDYLAKQTPDFQQQAFYNALLSKRAMLFDQDIEENIPYLKERTDTEKKVFFSSIGLIKNESGVGDIYGPKKSKEIIINNEAVTLANTLLNDYQDPVINESTYFLYSNIQQSYYKKIKLIDKQADGYYERYTSESARQAFYSQYAGLLEKIQKGENFFRNVMPSKVGAKLISIGRCITKDCYEKKTTGFETFQKNLARKYLKEKTEELTTFPFDYFCTQGNSKNSRTIIRTHKNGATDTRTHTNRMGNHSANTTLRCDVDLNHLGNAYLSKYKQTIDNTLNLSFKKYESLESFSKSSDFNDFIMYTAKRSGVRLILPKEW
ncbi:hypothetical protein, partial [Oleiphilus sp. HI0117]|uniref:hypothetical protein n=1 Tax=Oleiphilus sp. HI0117 TaxID=1822261 RepID=UPI000A53B975